jgi:TetR/AcrR family transcriptional repressor of nem operon
VLDGAATSQEARDLVRERLASVEAFFRAELARARDGAAVGPQVDPGSAAEMLLGTVLAIRVMARLDPEPGRLRRLADNALASLAPARGSTATTEQPKR